MNSTFVIPAILVLFVGVCVAVGLLAVAFLLVRSGKRGRLVNDHPICRACGFDLFNLPSDRTKCPECGGELKQPKAILPGRREPYLGRLWTGRALAALVLIVLGTAGWNVVQRNDFTAFKPDWWVTLETRYGAFPTQTRAWREITRRASAGTLSDDRIKTLVNSALKLQGDTSQTWISEAGDFIERTRKQGHVTDEQWALYAKQAPQLTLVVRSQVGRTAKYLPAELQIAKARSADNSVLVQRSEEGLATGDCIRVLPEWQRGRSSSGFTVSSSASGSHRHYIQLDPKVLATTQPGKRMVTVEVPIRFTDGWEDDAVEVHSETRTFQAGWELVDSDQAEIALLPDDSPEIRKQVENAISIESIEFKPHASNGDRVDVDIMANFLPVPVAYRVSLRSGGRTWDGINFRALPTTGRSQFGSSFAVKDFDAERVDVILEPRIDAALETIDMTQLWNGRIVIKDVAVVRKLPATQATTR